MRKSLKAACTAASVVLTMPLWLAARIEGMVSREDDLFRFFGQLLSLVPGIPGSFIRRGYYIPLLESCSWEFHIEFGSFFSHRNVRVGQRVNIGAFCVLGCVNLGDRVMLASRVSITSGKNQHYDDSGEVTNEHVFKSISIGDRTWIGEGAVVMEDVGRDSIVSAGSVVTKKAPDEIIAIGNPARFMPRYKKPAPPQTIDQANGSEEKASVAAAD